MLLLYDIIAVENMLILPIQIRMPIRALRSEKSDMMRLQIEAEQIVIKIINSERR